MVRRGSNGSSPSEGFGKSPYYYTDFKPLVEGMPTYSTGDDYGIYTNYSVLGEMTQILEAQNENLGTDVAPMEGQVVFRRSFCEKSDSGRTQLQMSMIHAAHAHWPKTRFQK